MPVGEADDAEDLRHGEEPAASEEGFQPSGRMVAEDGHAEEFRRRNMLKADGKGRGEEDGDGHGGLYVHPQKGEEKHCRRGKEHRRMALCEGRSAPAAPKAAQAMRSGARPVRQMRGRLS